MLDGDVQILDDLRLVGDGIDQLIIDLVGVEIVQPHPMDAVNLAQFPKQRCQKPLAAGKIRTVAAGVLRHDDQFLDPLACQNPCLIQHFVQPTAAESAPQRGDHAVSAMVIAALSDLQIRHNAPA